MHYCPNPTCRRNIKQTKKAFSSSQSLSKHIQLSPECKAFVCEQSAIAMTVSSLQVPPKWASINSTSNLFKKQRLWLNPTFLAPEVSNIAYLHGIEDEAITVDNNDASDNDLLQMDVDADVNSFASKWICCCCWFFFREQICWHHWSTCWQKWLCMFHYQSEIALHLWCICLMTWNVLIMLFNSSWTGHAIALKQGLILMPNPKFVW